MCKAEGLLLRATAGVVITNQNNGVANDIDIGYVKRELCDIERQKLAALGYKLKAKVLCEDEKLNLFHFVKQKDNRKAMNAVKIDGAVVRDQLSVKQHVENFYKSLLAEGNDVVCPNPSSMKTMEILS
jgi:hypothetical protein